MIIDDLQRLLPPPRNPVEAGVNGDWGEVITTLKEQYPETCPFPLMYEPGGLLPWGISIDGDIFCWRTEEVSGEWDIGYHVPAWGTRGVRLFYGTISSRCHPGALAVRRHSGRMAARDSGIYRARALTG